MKRKLPIIAAVLAVSFAAVIVVTVLLTRQLSEPKSPQSAAETALQTDAAAAEEATAAVQTDAVDESSMVADTVSAEETIAESDSLLPGATLSLQKVIQKDSSKELSPRVVFGEAYKDCYLKLNDDNIELCLNPYTGEVDTGTYTYDGKLMINFGYDRGVECQVILSDDGQLQYIVVEHDGYDLYFG